MSLGPKFAPVHSNKACTETTGTAPSRSTSDMGPAIVSKSPSPRSIATHSVLECNNVIKDLVCSQGVAAPADISDAYDLTCVYHMMLISANDMAGISLLKTELMWVPFIRTGRSSRVIAFCRRVPRHFAFSGFHRENFSCQPVVARLILFPFRAISLVSACIKSSSGRSSVTCLERALHSIRYHARLSTLLIHQRFLGVSIGLVKSWVTCNGRLRKSRPACKRCRPFVILRCNLNS